MESVFIVGCGDIGRRVARLWGGRGCAVRALARSPAAARRLERLGIAPVPGDLDDGATLRGLPTSSALVYYLAPPPDAGHADPRVRAFLSALVPGTEPERIVYMSTTGVYGDCRGDWVTEERPAAPATARARRRLDAETACLFYGRERGVPVVILRVSGIYGPGRLPVEAIRRGAPVLEERSSPFTNRIHAEDLARVCVAAALRGRPGGIYNVSDGRPGTITEFYFAVADLLSLPRPPAVDAGEAMKALSPGLLSYLAESRRIDNRRMVEELGVALLYRTLEEGLRASREEAAREPEASGRVGGD